MLIELSRDIADIVEKIGPSVVQVQGDRRPASGLVYAAERVLTTGAAIGREEHPRVRSADGQVFDGEVVGWHSNTRLALLKVRGFNSQPASIGVMPRVGHLAIAIARSWSNFITVTSGLVSVIGGPLRVGHRRAIEQVIRTSAPMHEGFAGGALLGADGTVIGVTTAASIRGLGVSIPADIAWAAAAEIEKQGTLKRGYIGIAALPVRVPEKQKAQAGTDNALLVVSVKDGSPAATAGFIVGDLLLSLDGQALSSPDDLLDMLVGERVGRVVSFRVLRGGVPAEVSVSVAERS